jgi:hypothetical protein
MIEENKNGDHGSVEPQKTGSEIKPNTGMTIVAYNLLALAVYTIACKFNEGGIILDAFLIFFHVIICIGMALGKKSWMWFLSAVLVLAIGFSTCVMFGNNLDFK